MNIVKEGQGGQSVAVTEQELEQINRLSRKKLTVGEVYTFSVRLCDNEIDRDWECFPAETLEQLAGLFTGKSGILDHNWSAAGQSARIYRTQVLEEPGRFTRTGEPGRYLKGWAYMVRTPSNADLIAEIEGGIKKEVSVGCAVKRSVCSVCGQDIAGCGHVKGREYGGALCYARLEEASDAFEFSFVAVPAQREAGVMKCSGPVEKLARLADGHPGCREELERLEKEARAGRAYLERLRDEVARLGGLAREDADVDVLRSAAGKLEEIELLELKESFRQRAGQRFGLKTQLKYSREEESRQEPDGAFLI